jgi:hypothetical protein
VSDSSAAHQSHHPRPRIEQEVCKAALSSHSFCHNGLLSIIGSAADLQLIRTNDKWAPVSRTSVVSLISVSCSSAVAAPQSSFYPYISSCWGWISVALGARHGCKPWRGTHVPALCRVLALRVIPAAAFATLVTTARASKRQAGSGCLWITAAKSATVAARLPADCAPDV